MPRPRKPTRQLGRVEALGSAKVGRLHKSLSTGLRLGASLSMACVVNTSRPRVWRVREEEHKGRKCEAFQTLATPVSSICLTLVSTLTLQKVSNLWLILCTGHNVNRSDICIVQ